MRTRSSNAVLNNSPKMGIIDRIAALIVERMKPSPLLLMLDALLGLVEQRLEREKADAAADLPLIGAQLQRLTGMLVRLTERGSARAAEELSSAAVGAILAARRLRVEHFGPKIGDAAWSLLLALYAARLEGRSCSATQLGSAAGLHPGTALRWLHELQRTGWVSWRVNPEEKRAALIELSDAGAAKVEAYLRTALRLSSLLA
jgi:DNA-binding MarR family transcriptional regulator